MFVTYEVWRDDFTNIEHHGKPEAQKHNLCFMCAVNAVVNNDEAVESKIVEEETNCDDCAL